MGATTLLSYNRTAEAARGLQTIAELPRLRAFAVYTLARTFGESATPELVATVSGYLKDDSNDVRAWTIRGLRWMRHDDARKLLASLAQDAEQPELSKLAARSLDKWRPAAPDNAQ
jgi:hypothetical protein